LVRKYRKTNGYVFLTFIWGYGVVRFLLEFIRDDEQRGGLGEMSTSQIIALVTSLAGIGLFIYLRDRARRGGGAAEQAAEAAAGGGGGAGGSRRKRR
jgi:phosphatidylglycerol:prolipoprotein diacylglycerol transferase